MLSLRTARRLRRAGLSWEPAAGDRFVVPDRDMDDDVFLVSDMVVEVRDGPAGGFVAFNGTTEWALDSVLQREVVWLPREDQLRALLGDTFVRLERQKDGYRCVTSPFRWTRSSDPLCLSTVVRAPGRSQRMRRVRPSERAI